MILEEMCGKTSDNRIRMFFLILLCSFLLCSCKGIELENKTEQVEEYTRNQAMILIANERNRYQKAYSPEIWKIPVDDSGTDFAALLVANVKDYLETVKLLCMMAQENGVSVTSREKEQIRQMTDEYMSRLTAEDMKLIGCSREDVQKMYTDYYTACKMADLFVKNSRTEISDAEVKVIRIMQIGTADLKKAKAILKKVKIDKADFNSMASRYTELARIEVELKKGTSDDIIERKAFELEEGEISNILFRDGIYYIIKCVNGYDREATEKRKLGLETAVNYKNYREALEPYEKEHNIVFFDAFWNKVNLNAFPDSEVDCFFDLYEEYAQ